MKKCSERQILDIYDLNDRIPAIKDLFKIVCQPVYIFPYNTFVSPPLKGCVGSGSDSSIFINESFP